MLESVPFGALVLESVLFGALVLAASGCKAERVARLRSPCALSLCWWFAFVSGYILFDEFFDFIVGFVCDVACLVDFVPTVATLMGMPDAFGVTMDWFHLVIAGCSVNP